MKHVLNCVARGRDQEWEALCLDLDVAVQGRSFDEVCDLLTQAIVNYVEEALDQPPEVRDALLSRRAPLSTRLWWKWRLALAARKGRGHTDESATGFSVPCPA